MINSLDTIAPLVPLFIQFSIGGMIRAVGS